MNETSTNASCPRCGRTDGTHIGYHDVYELPVKRGDRVRIRAGAVISSTAPGRRTTTNLRTRVVTVRMVDNGRNDFAIPVQYEQHPESGLRQVMVPVDDPGVTWAGRGGYWCSAKLTDVEVVR